MDSNKQNVWKPGTAPVAVVLITLNEGHNMSDVLMNLSGWAQEVFVVDSYSRDETVDIALRFGARVVQRKFSGFGDQWNFALSELKTAAPWTMKLDPDERLSEELKRAIERATAGHDAIGMRVVRRLYFMGSPLPVQQSIVRVWRTGKCAFSDVAVNEHPLVQGDLHDLDGELEHHDSPSLHHWFAKQNEYTSAEALAAYDEAPLAVPPRLLGTSLERRMWLKKNLHLVPFRFQVIFLYNLLGLGAIRAGWPGFVWARLRSDVYRIRYYKLREMRIKGQRLPPRPLGPGEPDLRVPQY